MIFADFYIVFLGASSSEIVCANELNWKSERLVSCIVKWDYQDNFKPVFFLFFTKKFYTKMQVMPKSTTSQNKNNKGNNFLRRKTPKSVKIVCYVFLKKNWNCLDILIYYTTELCSFNFAVIKLPIISQDSSTHFSNLRVKMKKIH